MSGTRLVGDIVEPQNARTVMELDYSDFVANYSIGYAVRADDQFADAGILILGDYASGLREVT